MPSSPPTHVPVVGQGVLAADRRAPQEMRTSVEEVQLAKGEMIKATYPVTRIRRPLGWIEAYLIVTDARIIYRAQASNNFNRSVTASEIHMSEVKGTSIDAQRGLTPLAAASLAFLGLVTLLMLLVMPVSLVFMVPIIGLVAWLGRSSVLEFSILSQVPAASVQQIPPISIASGVNSSAAGILRNIWGFLMTPALKLLELLGLLDSRRIALTGLEITGENRRALDEAIRMYDEIGALILDIKSSGVLADERR